VSPKIVTGTRSAVREHPGIGPRAKLGVDNDAARRAGFEARQAAGELGVVVGDRLAADQDGIGALRAAGVRAAAPQGP
jgi:hypothetical protein